MYLAHIFFVSCYKEEETQLQSFYNEHCHFPDIFYHQIDGGPENSNQFLLAMCELLVALKLVRKIVLTRLPVGHTHEDIDARSDS